MRRDRRRQEPQAGGGDVPVGLEGHVVHGIVTEDQAQEPVQADACEASCEGGNSDLECPQASHFSRGRAGQAEGCQPPVASRGPEANCLVEEQQRRQREEGRREGRTPSGARVGDEGEEDFVGTGWKAGESDHDQQQRADHGGAGTQQQHPRPPAGAGERECEPNHRVTGADSTEPSRMTASRSALAATRLS